jgi:hypothetical protein
MSDPQTFRIRNYYEQQVPIDDGVEGQSTLLPVRIKRFTVAEMQAFQRGFARLSDPPSKRAIFRQPDGDEQEKTAHSVVTKKTAADGTVTETTREVLEYRIPDSEITRRRLQEMTPDQLTAHEQAECEDEAFVVAFGSDSVTAYTWLPRHVTLEVEQEDGTTTVVKTGADLVTVFGGNLAMLIRLTAAIHTENALSAELKKVLRSPSDSTRSSLAPIGTADGGAPAAIATRAARVDSAASGDAMALHEATPSGSTVN